jgi:hypothetical protein
MATRPIFSHSACFVNTRFRLVSMPNPSVQKTLNILSAAYLVEALALYLAVAGAIMALFSDEPKSVPTLVALAAMALGAGLWMTFAAKGIRQGRRWARSAGIFWQLMLITVSFGIYEVSVLGALAIALPAGAVLITLFTKAVSEATRDKED